MSVPGFVEGMNKRTGADLREKQAYVSSYCRQVETLGGSVVSTPVDVFAMRTTSTTVTPRRSSAGHKVVS